MKLATLLKRGKYKLPPPPKPRKPETPEQRRRRKFGCAVDDFYSVLNKAIEKNNEENSEPWRINDPYKLDFLDVPLNYWEFEEIFEWYKENNYGGFEFEIKKDTWFTDYIQWLKSERFKLESIRMYRPHDPDDETSWTFRVRW